MSFPPTHRQFLKLKRKRRRMKCQFPTPPQCQPPSTRPAQDNTVSTHENCPLTIESSLAFSALAHTFTELCKNVLATLHYLYRASKEPVIFKVVLSNSCPGIYFRYWQLFHFFSIQSLFLTISVSFFLHEAT